MIRKHIYFTGRVQGVGFRYRAYYIARSLSLTGWVKNLWDERVEMEVQGEEKIITEFLFQLQQQRFIEIDHMEVEEIPVENEGSFGITG